MPSFVYAETLPFEALSTPGILGPLGREGLGLVAAVRPWDVDATPRLVDAAAAEGVTLRLWPMVEDEHGRWLNATSADRFARMIAAIDARVGVEAPLLMDLEVPHAQLHAWSTMPAPALCVDVARRAHGWHREASADRFAWLTEMARTRTIDAAVLPMLAWDDPGRAGWSRLLGLPELGFATTVSPMAYSTLLAGYSRGVIDRARAVRMVRAIAKRTVEGWGSRASLSLGCVGTGALGNEATYRTPDELAEDARAAREGGVVSLAAFDLGGMVRRGGVEPWLRAFAEGSRAPVGVVANGSPYVPSFTSRSAAALLRGVSLLMRPRVAS